MHFLALILLLLVPSLSWADAYFNSASEDCTSSSTRPAGWVFCDDFEDGVWYATGNDTGCTGGGNPSSANCHADNDGWNGCFDDSGSFSTTCRTPDPPAVSHSGGASPCNVAGVGGSGYAACSTMTGGSGENSALAHHGLYNDQGYDDFYQRFYFYLVPGYTTGGNWKGFSFVQGNFVGGVGAGAGPTHNITSLQFAPQWESSNDGNRNPQSPTDASAFMSPNKVNASCTATDDPWDCCTGNNTGTCGTTSNAPTISTGKWFFIEVHAVNNTFGEFDGILEMWVNDCGTDGFTNCVAGVDEPTMVSRYTNLAWMGPAGDCGDFTGEHCIGTGPYTDFGFSDSDELAYEFHAQLYSSGSPDQGTFLFDNAATSTVGPIGFIGDQGGSPAEPPTHSGIVLSLLHGPFDQPRPFANRAEAVRWVLARRGDK